MVSIDKEIITRDAMSAIGRRSGFTVLEVVVVLAILVTVVSLSVPAMKTWTPNRELRNAAMELYSSMLLAKSQAIRANRPFAVVFNAGAGNYQIVDSGADNLVGTVDDINGQTITLSAYGSGIAYGHTPAPAGSAVLGGGYDNEVTYAADTLTFDVRGMSNTGYVYLQNNNNRTYAVGTFMTGTSRLLSWSNGAWQ